MGGAVSSGRDNNELVDNLMSGNYIRSRAVEQVFRALDRADYMSAEARDQAYKDLAWRNGPLHLSAPCIYSEVMEALDLKPGLSFLNVGSGTGYLSTLVGLIIGSAGISHGVEAIPVVFDYANKKLSQFMENSITLDEFDFCMPKYYTGNGLCLAPTHTYDRVYCGAGVLSKYENYFKQFLKVGGVLVMPLADTLVQLRRVSESHWTKRNLLNVSFALLREPDKNELEDLVKLEEQCPSPLQALSRAAIRAAMRAGLMRRHPALRAPPPAPPAAPRAAPRRICIPYEPPSDDELNELHDLDEAGGAHEMNALLSLVLSMGQNRAAGSLRLDPVEDDDLDEDYVDVNEIYEDGEDPSLSPLLPDDGVIVFDVGGTMHARRWQTRGPRHRRALSQEPSTSTEQTETAEDAAPATDTLANSDAETTQNSGNIEKTKTDATGVSTSEATGALTSNSTAPETTSKSKTSSKPETSSKSEKSSKPETSSKSETKARPSMKSKARSLSPSTRPPARGPARTPSRRGAPRRSPRAPWTDSSSCDDDVTQAKESKRQKLDSGIGEGTASSGASPDKSEAKSSLTNSSKTENEDNHDTEMEWCDIEEDSNSSSGSSESSSSGDSESDGESGADDDDGKDAMMRRRRRTLAKLKRRKLDSGIAVGRRRGAANLARIRKQMAEAVVARRRVQRRLRPREPPSRTTSEEPAGGSGRGEEAAGSDSGTEEGGGPRARRPPPSRDMRRVNLSLAMKRGVKELPLPHALKKYVNYGRCYQF